MLELIHLLSPMDKLYRNTQNNILRQDEPMSNKASLSLIYVINPQVLSLWQVVYLHVYKYYQYGNSM